MIQLLSQDAHKQAHNECHCERYSTQYHQQFIGTNPSRVALDVNLLLYDAERDNEDHADRNEEKDEHDVQRSLPPLDNIPGNSVSIKNAECEQQRVACHLKNRERANNPVEADPEKTSRDCGSI